MITFGSDPEFILTLNDTCVSAIGKIKGTIDNRIEKNGHQFYSDNVLAECAIKPSKNKKETIDNFRDCLKIYSKLVKPYKIKIKASEIFPDKELLHVDARRVGCAKEFCAYEMKQQESPVSEILNNNLRSCGGHIHIGSKILEGDGPEPILLVYMMDLFLGIPSLWLDKDESSSKRRSIYGKAGRYRAKTYGIEYRSLGNFWLSSPDLVGLVYDLSLFCVNFVESGTAWDFWEFDIDKFLESENLSDAWECKGYNSNLLRKAIDSSNKELAKDHMRLVEKLLPKELKIKIDTIIENNQKDFYDSWGIK